MAAKLPQQCVGSTPSIDQAEVQSQYHPSCSTRYKTPSLTNFSVKDYEKLLSMKTYYLTTQL